MRLSRKVTVKRWIRARKNQVVDGVVEGWYGVVGGTAVEMRVEDGGDKGGMERWCGECSLAIIPGL
jgi:hypothetical protein